MAGELVDGGGTAAEGGASAVVDSGAAEGGAEFNMDNALNSISESLGFGESSEELKDGKAEGEGAPAPAKAATPAPTEAPSEAPAAAPTGAPKTWKTEEAALWASIPAAAQAAINRREEDMFQGIERYKATAQFGTTIQNVLQPYEGIMKAHGIDPVQNIDALMGAHYRLATGTNDQKLALFQQLANDYKVDLSVLGQAADPYAAPADPEVVRLQQELAELKSGQTRLQQQQFQETQKQVQSQVEAFATDPANVHFTEPGVADEIARLLKLDRSLTLEQAYDRAIWSNPAVRAKEIARQDADKQAKARAEAEASLAASRAASAANVKVNPKAGAATLPLGSMDDTLQETLRAMKSR